MNQNNLNIPERFCCKKVRVNGKFIILFCIIFATVLLSGCEDEYELADPIDLNRSLPYIQPVATPTPSNVCCKYEQKPAPTPSPSPTPERPLSIKIVPGMKLVFYGTSLRMKGTNIQQPMMAQYEWIMPNLPENPRLCDFQNEQPLYEKTLNFTRQDYHFLEYLLTVSTPEGCVLTDTDLNRCNASEKLKEFARNLSNNDSNAFNRRYSECFLIPTLNTLELFTAKIGYFTPVLKTEDGNYEIKNRSAEELRELFAKPMREEFETQTSKFNSHWLQAMFLPGTDYAIELRSYDWSSHYFNDDVQERDKTAGGFERNPWYDAASTISGSRGFVEVEVPIRISSEIDSRWYPAYFSFHDLEERLGLKIVGFRRSKKFLGTFNFNKKNKTLYFDPECAECKKTREKFLAAGDDYFTVKFGKKGKSFNADAVVVLPNNQNAKRDVLLAPGDVILVAKRRLEATDHPEVR